MACGGKLRVEVSWSHRTGSPKLQQEGKGSSKLDRCGQMWALLPKGQVTQCSVQEEPKGMRMGAG